MLLVMTDDDLLQRVRERSQDPRLATSAGGWGAFWKNPESFQPCPIDVARDAEKRLGFALPPLLVRIWTEIANGGIGPGYGIYGLEGGMTDEYTDLPIPDLLLACRDDNFWIEIAGEDSAAMSLPICDWGCCTGSAIDCSIPEGKMILFLDGTERVDQGVTFAQWISDWVEGIDVGAREYRSTD
jgi:hypothetical protein